MKTCAHRMYIHDKISLNPSYNKLSDKISRENQNTHSINRYRYIVNNTTILSNDVY